MSNTNKCEGINCKDCEFGCNQSKNNMKKPVNKNNQYKKGEMLINLAGWSCIVMEATRGNNPTIIPMVEVYGLEHECGSIYTNEIRERVGKNLFEHYKALNGFKPDESQYFKGELVEPTK